jgi:glyoxylase-like metal-dependent hydrolase (beta-lactamase superfamily II)/rhodanese-related sulfurtransferase
MFQLPLVYRFNEEGCLSYIVACPHTKDAVAIDPTLSSDKFMHLIRQEGLTLRYILETHTHVDHLTAAGELAKATGAKIAMFHTALQREKTNIEPRIPHGIVKIIHQNYLVRPDFLLQEGESLDFGEESIRSIAAPGHTTDSMILQIKHLLFTGDALFVGQCGRTDLPGGSAANLYHTLFQVIYPMSDSTVIYPAHDYQGNINSALGYEKVHNPFLQKREQADFVQFVVKQFPPLTGEGEKIQCSMGGPSPAVPGEQAKVTPVMHELCFHMEQYLRSAPKDWHTISVKELHEDLEKTVPPLIIDVREPQELQSGYLPGSINIPLRQLPAEIARLPADKNSYLVTICRSGSRSAYAALYLRSLGYLQVKNVDGGVPAWQQAGFPVSFPKAV